MVSGGKNPKFHCVCPLLWNGRERTRATVEDLVEEPSTPGRACPSAQPQMAKKLGLTDFRVGRRLGAGAFGEVFVATRKRDGANCVLKAVPIVDVTRKEQEAALNEVKLLSHIDHPRVVAYLASFVADKKLHIVMEWCEGGDLRHVIEARKDALGAAACFPEKAIWKYVTQVAQGLEHLHSLKVLHRDLKSSNLFLKQGMVKLGDLGCSRLLGTTGDLAATMIGTPYYLSPELCSNEPYDAKSDMWALGVVAYELCTCGDYPFTAHNQAALIMRIIRGNYESPPAHLSTELRDGVVHS
jgi:NIMA (never in mitosis gene a)-related kinase